MSEINILTSIIIKDAKLESFLHKRPHYRREVWNDKYFVEKHAPNKKYSFSSTEERRKAFFNVMKLFAGETTPYSTMFEDMKIVILSMPSPENIEELLFKELITEGEGYTQVSPATDCTEGSPIVPDITNQFKEAKSDTKTPENEEGLAGYVRDNETDFSCSTVEAYWKGMAEILSQSSTQEKMPKLVRYAEAILGLTVMQCFKLICTTAESAHTSMRSDIESHFRSFYKPEKWTLTITPPHFNTLSALYPAYQSLEPGVKEIISILLSKLMFVSSEAALSRNIESLLFRACLNQIVMYGFEPIKYLQMATRELDMTMGEFAALICTKSTSKSLTDCFEMLKVGLRRSMDIHLLGAKLNIMQQVTWRFSRIYNQCHFSQFNTSNNIDLILRCAAYLKASGKSGNILPTAMLSSPSNQAIYERELDTARSNIERLRIADDTPMLPETTLPESPIE